MFLSRITNTYSALYFVSFKVILAFLGIDKSIRIDHIRSISTDFSICLCFHSQVMVTFHFMLHISGFASTIFSLLTFYSVDRLIECKSQLCHENIFLLSLDRATKNNTIYYFFPITTYSAVTCNIIIVVLMISGVEALISCWNQNLFILFYQTRASQPLLGFFPSNSFLYSLHKYLPCKGLFQYDTLLIQF